MQCEAGMSVFKKELLRSRPCTNTFYTPGLQCFALWSRKLGLLFSLR